MVRFLVSSLPGLQRAAISLVYSPHVAKEKKFQFLFLSLRTLIPSWDPHSHDLIYPKNSFERLMLKLQYFSHLMQRTDSLDKTLMLEKVSPEDELFGWHHRPDGHESEQTLGE